MDTTVAYFRGDQTLYGEIKAELAQGGRPIPDNDLWIVALARQHDLPLATRDAHFRAIPLLRTLAWQRRLDRNGPDRFGTAVTAFTSFRNSATGAELARPARSRFSASLAT
jgi:hypothetical protein